MSFTFDTFAAAVAIMGAVASFAVCRWRIGYLERRVDALESSERNHSERMAVVETKLTNIEALLIRVAEKLNAK